MVIASRLGNGKAVGLNPATLMEPLDENEEVFMVIASRLGNGKAVGSNPVTPSEPLDINEEVFYFTSF